MENKKETVIEIEHLQKSFGDNHVLVDINLKMYRGENLVVLGRSGTGKSVLIKCLVRLLESDSGKMIVFGENINELNDDNLNKLRQKIGFLFQSSALYDSMTVRENLEFPLRLLPSEKKKEMKSRVHEALKNVGLTESIDKMPSELSGGMRKRIGLARTLILQPEIILYDEPTTGLDPITAMEISHLILDVQKKYNTTSMIITHDINCARVTANRMVMLKDGLLAGEGTYDELEKSKDKQIRSFFDAVNK
jgi:phospholipid/cholesterol/gamma-HCH transport system ATP-binding protein